MGVRLLKGEKSVKTALTPFTLPHKLCCWWYGHSFTENTFCSLHRNLVPQEKKKASIVFRRHTQWKKVVKLKWKDFFFFCSFCLIHHFISDFSWLGWEVTFGSSETKLWEFLFKWTWPTFWQMFWNRTSSWETEMLLWVSISWQELWNEIHEPLTDLWQWSWMTSGRLLCSIVQQMGRGGGWAAGGKVQTETSSDHAAHVFACLKADWRNSDHLVTWDWTITSTSENGADLMTHSTGGSV